MTQTPNGRVAERLAAGHRLNGRLVLGVGMVAAAALLTVSLASGALQVQVAPRPPAYRAPPTTQTPGQPSTGPATTGPAATGRPQPPSGVPGHQPGPARPAADHQTPPRATAPLTTDPGPGPPPGGSGEVLVRARVRAVGACVEVVAGIPPVRTCRGGT